MTDEAMILREAAHNLSGTDPQETQALMQMAANKIDELRAKLAELENQQPVAWMNTSRTLAWSQHDMDSFDDESRYNYPLPLYLAAGAKQNE